MKAEEWRDVEGYVDYYRVSSYGRIMSRDRVVPNRWGNGQHRKGKLMSPGSSPNGYKIITLHKKGKVKYQTVHRTVAAVFLPNPENKPEINHIDGNKENNNIKNLEWVTVVENKKHAQDTGLFSSKGENNPNVKLTESDVRCIRLSNVAMKELAEIYNVSRGAISKIKTRRSWKNVS